MALKKDPCYVSGTLGVLTLELCLIEVRNYLALDNNCH